MRSKRCSADGVTGTDGKPVELAGVRGGKVVTNDYNLNRLAGLSGVEVLNINELGSGHDA